MSTHPLDCLEPSDQSLLDLMVEQIDDAMLLKIARCDCGDDVEIHLAALHQIRAKNIPVPLKWHPGEVLCLTRWTELESLKSLDGGISTPNHWMRLFACTALIWASLEPENDDDRDEDWNHTEGEESTIIQFLDSALYLGDDVSIASLKFLAWRMQGQIKGASTHEDFGNCPCYAVAMILLCVSLNRCDHEVISFLIHMAYYNHDYLPVYQEINNCQLSRQWRSKIYQILLNPRESDNVKSGKEHAASDKRLLPIKTLLDLRNLGETLMYNGLTVGRLMDEYIEHMLLED
jgi:hypothetical protein